VWIEPFSGFGIAVGADFDLGAFWLVVNEIPPLPAAPVVGWILRGAVLLFIEEIPFPRALLFRKALPGFVPEFVRPGVLNDPTPAWLWSDAF
jgi:hypothetical protein